VTGRCVRLENVRDRWQRRSRVLRIVIDDHAANEVAVGCRTEATLWEGYTADVERLHSEALANPVGRISALRDSVQECDCAVGAGELEVAEISV